MTIRDANRNLTVARSTCFAGSNHWREMLRRYREQHHIDLDSGRSCLALERKYWQALEVLAYEEGWNNWRDFFYMRILTGRSDDIPPASFVRQSTTEYLFKDQDKEMSQVRLNDKACKIKTLCRWH